MKSSPSRPKRASSTPREPLAELLRNGRTISDPEPEILAAAKQLEQLGLIWVEIEHFVRCVDPGDSDYLDSDQRCTGVIYVPENVKESIDDYCCSECGRWVFPADEEKRLHKELRTTALPAGVDVYLQSMLVTAGLPAKKVCEGVLRVDVEPLGVFLCVAENCLEQKFLLRDWPAAQPTCYVLVDEWLAENHFLDEAWLHRLYLADLVCGEADIAAAIDHAANSPPPAQLPHAVPRVYGLVPTRAPAMPRGSWPPPRRFMVVLDKDSVWVEGLQVVGSHAGPRLEIFRLLWESYLNDLLQGVVPEEFHTQSLQAIVQQLEPRLGKGYPDETTVRRMINRLQTDVETIVKRELGLAINREDIVQTCAWKGQNGEDHGYRLNPFRVFVGSACSVR